MSETAPCDYGPLTLLIGHWTGAKGLDVAPSKDGCIDEPYSETLVFEPLGDVTNASEQTLVLLRYHQVVSRLSDGEVFHNETGYFSWDHERQVICQSLTIPRGLSLLAEGTILSASHEQVSLAFQSSIDDAHWSIVQSPFMTSKATTRRFTRQLDVTPNALKYTQCASLEIYGDEFEHTDENVLIRV